MEYERLSDVDTENVLLEFDTDGEEDILTQVLKLSEETWNEPEQEVFDVSVVTEVVSIVSEKVTEIEELTETEVSESEGEVDETVGGVVSVVELSVVWLGLEESPTSSFFSPHEGKKNEDCIKKNFHKVTLKTQNSLY